MAVSGQLNTGMETGYHRMLKNEIAGLVPATQPAFHTGVHRIDPIAVDSFIADRFSTKEMELVKRPVNRAV